MVGKVQAQVQVDARDRALAGLSFAFESFKKTIRVN
jgi:hypothetical protein